MATPASDQPADGVQPAREGRAQPDGLSSPISQVGLPDDVRRSREEQEARDAADRQRLEPRIEAHIAAHRMALDYLAERHQALADELDFDLVGDTRPAAIWQMAGRCIGLARLILDALQLGYTTEMLHLARALHEANRLLTVFGLEEGTDLLRKWLADEGNEWVRPKEARAAEAEFEERLAEAMRAAGLPELERTSDRARALYGHQSQAAHHRRRWTQDAVFPQQRTMLRGRASVWVRRAATTAAMVGVVEECVQAVGDALQAFHPAGWYGENVKPFVESFEALRRTSALP